MRITKFIKRKQLVIPFCLALFGAVCFSVMVWLYQNNDVIGMDETVIGWMVVIRRDWLTWVFRAITLFGSVTFIVTTGLAITAVGIWKKYIVGELLIWNFTNISGVILMEIFKMFFGRARPPLPWFSTATGFSFPSGHTMLSTIFYGFLLFLVVRNKPVFWGQKRLMIILVWIPVWVGFSRVYLGVHYASDVLAGWAAGVAWVGVWMVVRQLGMRREA